MKRILRFIILSCVVLSLLCAGTAAIGDENIILDPASGDAGLYISASCFPDANFRSFISSNYDLDRDGFLSEYEIANVRSMNCSGMQILDLTGIAFFEALTDLDCSNNRMVSLNVSRNPALTTLYCQNNRLKTLNVSNTALIGLDCSDNRLFSLDVSRTPALTELNCQYNLLKSLDVSGIAGLKWLTCNNNRLTGLELENASLLRIDCSNNQLTGLNLSLGAVEELHCGYNQLTSLNLNTPVLTGLYCYGNQLTSLDLSRTPALNELFCSDNQLASLDISGTALTSLYCGYNQLTSLQVSHTTLRYLDCGSNLLTSLDASCNELLEVLSCNDNSRLTVLNASHNPVLSQIFCYNTQLTRLDASHNRSLYQLDCYNNRLESLDVSGDAALRRLLCYNNRLTSLDLSSNTALERLSCYGNRLMYLDLSCNMGLNTLECYNNHLSSLDASSTGLTWISCHNNRREVEVDAHNQFDLSTLPGFDVSRASNWNGGTVDGTILTFEEETVSYTYDLWNSRLGNPTFTLTKESNPYGLDISETNFPDLNFRSFVNNNLDWDDDGYLSEAEIENVRVLYLWMPISELSGIEYFTELTQLDCSDILMTSLDVSRNTKLVRLDCSNNRLTNLDVGSNLALTWLRCDNNLLTSLDLSQNAALEALYCGDNGLMALDVSQNPALEYLDCSGNGLTSLDLSGNPALIDLFCTRNGLTALDVSGNPALTTLYCGGNQLTSLHTENNGALTSLGCSDNRLTKLDLSGNAALEVLWCDHNELAALDVSGNPALTELECFGNRLTELDVSGSAVLDCLDCSDNRLAALDLSGSPALTRLVCADNCLTELDVSGNAALIRLDCSGNRLICLDVSQNPALASFYFKCSDNLRPVTVNASGQLELSALPGFEVSRASDWSGAFVEDGILTFTAEEASYTYDVGNGNIANPTFTLRQTVGSIIIDYNPNGGAGAPDSQAKAPGVALTLSSVIPTREGFFFLAWVESTDAESAAYLPGDLYTEDADLTLWALWGQPDFVMPGALATVEEEAFANCAFRFAALPENTEEIGRRAFDGCTRLKYIYIPESCVWINRDAFGTLGDVTVLGVKNSYAETYARQKQFSFIPVA